MGIGIRTNVGAANAVNYLSKASKEQLQSFQKLSSGFKINKSADDASGLAISEKMRNQINALDTAKSNCEDGANFIQTAEGYLSETHDIIGRMVELSEKSANGVLADEDRAALQEEMDSLSAEVDRIASTANYNGHKLFDGSLGEKGKVEIISDSNAKKVYSKFKVDSGSSAPSVAPTVPATIKVVDDSVAVSAGGLSVKNISSLTADETYTYDGSAWKDSKGNTASVSLGFTNGDTFSVNSSGKAGATTSKGVTITTTAQNTSTYRNKTFKYDETQNKWLSGSTNWGKAVNFTVKAGTTFSVPYKNVPNPAYTPPPLPSTADDEKNSMIIQIGDSSTSADRLKISMNSIHTDTLFGGISGFKNTTIDNDNDNSSLTAETKVNSEKTSYNNSLSVDITKSGNASAAADALRTISNYISEQRGQLGALQNRMDHTINTLTVSAENISASKSRIQDTDMANEMMKLTSTNILSQSAQSMLAQANAHTSDILSLIQQ